MDKFVQKSLAQKRWNFQEMLTIGQNLFAKTHKRKRSANHNAEIHYLAREINEWLPQGIHALINGTYTPRHLKRYYFSDEMVDQLHISDRIYQHVLLKQLKPTFKHIMSPNCYHLVGPTGVKLATQKIRQVLEEEKPQYVLRIDVKSFYKSISHFRLIQDIKKYYDDPKVQTMLEEIIKNPIDTPRGCKNPTHGIALRGPLSQFFSGLFLKPLDDAFDKNKNVTYLRYQDDVILFCRSKKQLNRCRRKMLEILHERGLSLSRKKSRMGPIETGFHFLGVHYLLTQPEDYTNKTSVNDDSISKSDHILSDSGGGRGFLNIKHKGQCESFLMHEQFVKLENKSE